MNDETARVLGHNGSTKQPQSEGGDGCDKGRKTFGCILGESVNVAPCFTEEVVGALLDDIQALLREEATILDNLDLTAVRDRCKLPSPEQLASLEQAAADLTRINDRLIEGANQLPPRPALDQYLNARTGLDEYSRRFAQREESVLNDRKRLPELRSRIASLVMRERANRRPGGARPSTTAARAQHGIAGSLATSPAPTNIYSPTPIEHHDVLVIAPLGVHADEEFYRFPVIKSAPTAPGPVCTGPGVGEYRDPPELLDAFDQGQRRVLSVARPQDWGSASVRATQRGPAFSTLPLKPEPEPAAGNDSNVCYLINAQNLNFRNAWTAEEWNDPPGGVDLPPARGARLNEMEALLAGPQGRVFLLRITDVAAWAPGTTARIIATSTNENERVGGRELGCIDSVKLNRHMEVWHQLRGGTAMGRVYFDDATNPRVVPLVNITTLTLD